MSFLEKLKNSRFIRWLNDLLGIPNEDIKAIPEAIPVRDENIREAQAVPETAQDADIIAEPATVTISAPKRLNKFEQFQADIAESEHFKSLSDKNKLRYSNTIEKLYIIMGGKIPRKQPFVLHQLQMWHDAGKIEHLENVSENWLYEYSNEFEKYFSQYKDIIVNNALDYNVKNALDFVQTHPEQINYDVFPPDIEKYQKEEFVPIVITSSDDVHDDEEEYDDNPIIKPANYDNYANYLYDTPVKDKMAMNDNEYVEKVFQELFADVNNNAEEETPIADMIAPSEYSFYSETALEELFDSIFGSEPVKADAVQPDVAEKANVDIPLELLADLKNQAIDNPYANQ